MAARCGGTAHPRAANRDGRVRSAGSSRRRLIRAAPECARFRRGCRRRKIRQEASKFARQTMAAVRVANCSAAQHGGAPEWAAYFANLNTMFTSNLGNANARLYPLAGFRHSTMQRAWEAILRTSAGWPDFCRLTSGINRYGGWSCGRFPVPVAASGSNPDGSAVADGTTVALVQASLIDGNGFAASGKTVAVSAGAAASDYHSQHRHI